MRTYYVDEGVVNGKRKIWMLDSYICVWDTCKDKKELSNIILFIVEPSYFYGTE